jgi:hypothetical protein
MRRNAGVRSTSAPARPPGVSGVAEFNFRFENSPPAVVRELLRELALVV